MGSKCPGVLRESTTSFRLKVHTRFELGDGRHARDFMPSAIDSAVFLSLWEE
jgi:hypothetical protein